MGKGVGALVGAGAGAIGSMLLSELAAGKMRWPLILATTVGGGLIGAVVAPGEAKAATQAPAGLLSLTVSDPPVVRAINATPGTLVTLSLPPGAVWQNVSVGTPGNEFLGNLVAKGSTAPVTIPIPPVPGATIDANWTTADSQAHFQAIIALPAGATLPTPVTDGTAVSAVQSVINAVAKDPYNTLVKTGLQSVPVNGSASNPDFVKQLATVQGFVNAEFAKMGRPVNLRTDGVLDYATYAIFSVPL